MAKCVWSSPPLSLDPDRSKEKTLALRKQKDLMQHVSAKIVVSARKLVVSLFRSSNSAPSRKGCAVNGQMTKESNK